MRSVLLLFCQWQCHCQQLYKKRDSAPEWNCNKDTVNIFTLRIAIASSLDKSITSLLSLSILVYVLCQIYRIKGEQLSDRQEEDYSYS